MPERHVILPRRSRTLVRALPKMGLCSRSQSYELIRSGHVTLNGRIVTDPNKEVKQADKITAAGAAVAKKQKRYIILHKPAGYVTTRKDEKARPTVYDILGNIGDWVFPVGRLDKDTEGLLIFTNDTSFGDYMTDPVNKMPRTYRATVEGIICEEVAEKTLKGIDIGRDERSKPIGFKVLKRLTNESIVEVTLTEGKNREVRRLCDALGTPVKRLLRIQFGPYRLGDLPEGAWREVKNSLTLTSESR